MPSWLNGVMQQVLMMLVQLAALGLIAILLYLKQKITTYIDAHTTLKQRQVLEQLGREAFSFAETVYPSLDGPAKLNEATKYMISALSNHNMNQVPMTDMRAAIENAWLHDRRASGVPVTKNNVSTEIR